MSERKSSPFRQSLERFSSILTQDAIKSIHNLQETPLPTGIRLNPLKVDPLSAINRWANWYNWQIHPLEFCPNGWTIESSGVSPGSTIEHRMGQYYIQDAASMVPGSMFDIDNPHPLILDMAASPGGKTTHLIDLTLDKGFVLANDASPSRISALRSVLSNWSGINLAITQFPGELIGGWFPETFDMILLDAPCSMENLRPTDNHPLRETTIDERSRLHQRQVELLKSGLAALKIGGELVYSTCSLAPEEDEFVLDAVLHEYPGLITVEDVSKKFKFRSPGLTQFEGQNFINGTENALRLWPHQTGMSGFFAALFKKHQPIATIKEIPPQRPFSKTNLISFDEMQRRIILQQINHNFGFQLDDLILENHWQLFQRYDQVLLIPQTYLEKFISLPYAYLGMPVGKWVNDQLEPSHIFISRFGHQFKHGKIMIEDELVNQWIAGRDIRHPEISTGLKSEYCLVTDRRGRNLGLGKLLPKRLRNLLPRRAF